MKKRRRPLWPWLTVTSLACFGLGFLFGSSDGFELAAFFGRTADSEEPAKPMASPPRPEAARPTPAPEPVPVEPEPGGGARVAIVIDDLGRSLGELDRLAALGVPLTYSVLPFESRTGEVAATLRERQAQVICHLPMQARNGADPGPGALERGMSRRQLARATREALARVPGAVGVNNHMGSEISSDRRVMRPVLKVLDELGLFYLDSRTSPDSVGYRTALELGLRAAERQVFLDTDRSPAAVQGQFAELLAEARKRGRAIAIGHPYPETVQVLAAELPRAIARGYEFVPVSRLLEQR